MADAIPGTANWFRLVQEPIIDPERPIIDPHHHLWTDAGGRAPYLLAEFWADTHSGHRIEKTVFIEWHASYHQAGPDYLRSLGETEFAARIARASREGDGGTVVSGIVAHADLRLGPALRNVLRAHEDAAEGLLRGIRHAAAWDPHPNAKGFKSHAPEGLYADTAFRSGVALLGELGYSYDGWHYHHQNVAFAELARAVPGTTLVLDHFGTPLGVGPYAGQREAIYDSWRSDLAEIAKCPNVVAKLGGLAMPFSGFGWHLRDRPASSDELVSEQARYYHHAIECFGPARCMFESNFPVDRHSLSYPVYWNAMKKIAQRYSTNEQSALFYDTAARVYRL
jgi:predicted TIM-barrel fold metal-dependent hydrolase